MLRQLLTRPGGLALVVLVLGLAGLTTSCGGGDGYAAKDMVLVEFLFVDRALVPTAPTGTENLPRNAQVLMVFSEVVNPGSVNDQTVQIRYGPTGQSVPKGSFSIDGNTVRFDPTVTAQGQPNPFGFLPVTQYLVDIPNFEEQPAVIENLDADPNLVTFFTTFVTSDAFLRELQPPEVVRVYSIPDRFVVNPITGQWPGNGLLAIEFNEPMDPGSFILGGPAGPTPITSVDVRYKWDEQINQDNGLVYMPDDGPWIGAPIPGSFQGDAAATTYFFSPTFSFGSGKYVFTAQVFQGLKDLSGNLLVNPRSFGPYTCDGTGIATGKILGEDFMDQVNLDVANSDGPDWGFSEEGVLQSQEISSREMYLYAYTFQGTGPNDYGQYAAIISPFAGAALNKFVSGVSPPTVMGRRVMWAFSDDEMGANGSVTAAGWGPDSNATFAAIYPSIFLRAGFQKTQSLSLSPSFSGNYDGKATVVYTGSYQVGQSQNVGNTISVTDPGGYSQNFGCTAITPWNSPLWDYTGFEPWPEFSTFFEWNEGDANVPGDSVFLFDASVDEGDTWQQVRGWFAATYPCSGILIPGFPNRRMYTTFEEDQPDPPPSFAAGILNPEPSVTDTSFTITKRVSVAQVLFYTDGKQPADSTAQTFGPDSDYLPVELVPTVQSGGTQVRIEFQAAHGCEADRRTPNVSLGPPTEWTENINDCDGFERIRWRMNLISNLIINTRARLYHVAVPVIDANNP